MAGFTLGGGIGRLARAHGLAADNRVSVELVTADGRHVTASDEENPSLFWAVRGGGGDFGVVTAFEFALHEIGPEVWAGQLVYRIDDAPQVLRAMRGLIVSAPDALNVSATIARSEGHPGLVLNPFWIGKPTAADAAVQPLRDAATPINDLQGPASYLALQSVDVPGGRRSWETSAYLGKLSDNTLDGLVAHAAATPLEAPRIGLLPLNGAVARVPGAATAFGGRGAGWLVSAGGTWDSGSEDAVARGWTKRSTKPSRTIRQAWATRTWWASGGRCIRRGRMLAFARSRRSGIRKTSSGRTTTSRRSDRVAPSFRQRTGR